MPIYDPEHDYNDAIFIMTDLVVGKHIRNNIVSKFHSEHMKFESISNEEQMIYILLAVCEVLSFVLTKKEIKFYRS